MNEEDVLQAVRTARESYCQQFGWDLEAIVRDLREREQQGGRKVVNLTPRRPNRTPRVAEQSPA